MVAVARTRAPRSPGAPFNESLAINANRCANAMTEPSESPAALFQRTLHIGTDLANALERGGLTRLDEVAYIPHWELAEIGQLDEVQTQRLREVARKLLLTAALGDTPPPDYLGDEPPDQY
jgi:hypothetical protein